MIEVPLPDFEKEDKSPEVNIHIASFAPLISGVRSEQIIKWVDESGADGIEWMAVGPNIPGAGRLVGPTGEVLTKPVAALQKVYGEKLKSGHVTFNRYASFWNILGRREDPLRPGEKIALYNLGISSEKLSADALKKLEEVHGGVFPVIVYPPFGDTHDEHLYKTPLIQTHPAVFNDGRNAGELVKAVEEGIYAGVCADLYHMQEATGAGERPFGSQLDGLKRSLEAWMGAGVLKEVHVQPGRLTHLDETIDSEEDLRAALTGSYTSVTGQLLQFLVHDLGFLGPFVSEVNPQALAKIHGLKSYVPPTLLEDQAAVIDYIRRA